jgi:hypothetical protein
LIPEDVNDMAWAKHTRVVIWQSEWDVLLLLPIGRTTPIGGKLFTRTFNIVNDIRSHAFFVAYGEGCWRLKIEFFGNPCGEMPLYGDFGGDKQDFDRDLIMLRMFR